MILERWESNGNPLLVPVCCLERVSRPRCRERKLRQAEFSGLLNPRDVAESPGRQTNVAGIHRIKFWGGERYTENTKNLQKASIKDSPEYRPACACEETIKGQEKSHCDG